MCHAVGVTSRVGLDIYRDLTIRPRRRQWERRWEIDFAPFQTFSALYQVKQVPKSRETRFKLVFLELTSGDRA